MPSAEQITQQQELLEAYRSTLANYLKQQALQGGAPYALPGVLNGIREARENIKRIKLNLRIWGVQVDDHLDDTEQRIENLAANVSPTAGKTGIATYPDNQLGSYTNTAELAAENRDSGGSNKPQLIGVLVDFSLDTLRAVANMPRRAGVSRNQVTDAILVLANRIAGYSEAEQSEEVLPSISLFVYGYGFGDTLHTWAKLTSRLGRSSISPDAVPTGSLRDVFANSKAERGDSTTVDARTLRDQWSDYEQLLRKLRADIAGGPPRLNEGLVTIHQRFINELEKSYYENMLLFIISSGHLGKDTKQDVVKSAAKLKALGIQIISCYIGPKNTVKPKKLYNIPLPAWKEEAQVLFECASRLSPQHPQIRELSAMVQESGWDIPENAALFVQANETTSFGEFIKSLVDFS